MELAAIPRRVAEKENHRLAVSQAAFRHFEDFVGYPARLIEDVKGSAIGRVVACKAFAIFFFAALCGNEPRISMSVEIHLF